MHIGGSWGEEQRVSGVTMADMHFAYGTRLFRLRDYTEYADDKDQGATHQKLDAKATGAQEVFYAGFMATGQDVRST